MLGGLNLNAAAARSTNLRTAFIKVATDFDPANGGQPLANDNQTRFLTQFERRAQPGNGANGIRVGHALCLPTTPTNPATLADLAERPISFHRVVDKDDTTINIKLIGVGATDDNLDNARGLVRPLL